MSTPKETSFIKLIVSAERRILGYLIALMPAMQDAEDLMQETSIVMWEKYDEFLETQEGEPDLERFVAWGNKIAFYKVLNARRHKSNTVRLLSSDVIELVSEEWLRQDDSGQPEIRQRALASCLDELPKERRDLLREYYWVRSSVEKIGEKFDRTAGSVYKALQRTRQSLHKCIEKKLSLG